MSRFRKSFNGIYEQLWDILDKPKLNYRDRQRCKQLLNQLFNEHYFGRWYKPLRFTSRDCKGGKKMKDEDDSHLGIIFGWIIGTLICILIRLVFGGF